MDITAGIGLISGTTGTSGFSGIGVRGTSIFGTLFVGLGETLGAGATSTFGLSGFFSGKGLGAGNNGTAGVSFFSGMGAGNSGVKGTLDSGVVGFGSANPAGATPGFCWGFVSGVFFGESGCFSIGCGAFCGTFVGGIVCTGGQYPGGRTTGGHQMTTGGGQTITRCGGQKPQCQSHAGARLPMVAKLPTAIASRVRIMLRPILEG